MKQKFWDRQLVRVALAVLLSRAAVLLIGYLFYLLREPDGTLGLFKDCLLYTSDAADEL